MKVVVVECKLPDMPSKVDEVVSMAETLGYKVEPPFIQNRKSVHHSYCIGPGRLHDLKRVVEEKSVDLVIFTNRLPSSQIFKVQRELGGDIKVIDRNLLILEVFDKRAMTKEGKLQIRLARLKYTLSWGKEFIKMRGIAGEQVGWMGPGDYPYKEYLKAARSRISRLEKELSDTFRVKSLRREKRRELGMSTVALAGYTQSGKTTLFNRLTSETKSVGLGPFTTLSTFARRVTYPSAAGRNLSFMMIDSIGFIEDMHPIIIRAFNSTLGEITNADLILLIVDVSEPLEVMERKLMSTLNIMRQTGPFTNMVVCANKADLVDEDELTDGLALIERMFPEHELLPISANTGMNLTTLLSEVERHLNSTGHPERVEERILADAPRIGGDSLTFSANGYLS